MMFVGLLLAVTIDLKGDLYNALPSSAVMRRPMPVPSLCMAYLRACLSQSMHVGHRAYTRARAACVLACSVGHAIPQSPTNKDFPAKKLSHFSEDFRGSL